MHFLDTLALTITVYLLLFLFAYGQRWFLISSSNAVKFHFLHSVELRRYCQVLSFSHRKSSWQTNNADSLWYLLKSFGDHSYSHFLFTFNSFLTFRGLCSDLVTYSYFLKERRKEEKENIQTKRVNNETISVEMNTLTTNSVRMITILVDT